MEVDLTQLPSDIYKKIPMSIRSAQDVYDLSELPPKIQEMIREYFEYLVPVEYKEVIDLKASVSKYSDIKTITNVKDVVVEYLKNYLYTLPGSYPFDPLFGCRLKYYLQTKDTQMKRLLISDELNNIVNVLSTDLSMPITVKGITINPVSSHLNTVISCKIELQIPGEEGISVEMTAPIEE